jgi:hypothetical protein
MHLRHIASAIRTRRRKPLLNPRISQSHGSLLGTPRDDILMARHFEPATADKHSGRSLVCEEHYRIGLIARQLAR